jgi:2-(3-amino-3-carboxypropyl)histidine synthase
MKTIQELEQEYDFEFEKIEETIKKEKAKRVLLQFPDGIKPYADLIVNELKNRCKNVEFFIWLGSCFGACDIPIETQGNVDLVVQFGHTAWDFEQASNVKVLD